MKLLCNCGEILESEDIMGYIPSKSITYEFLNHICKNDMQNKQKFNLNVEFSISNSTGVINLDRDITIYKFNEDVILDNLQRFYGTSTAIYVTKITIKD